MDSSAERNQDSGLAPARFERRLPPADIQQAVATTYETTRARRRSAAHTAIDHEVGPAVCSASVLYPDG
jgi:hypothetical protein